MTEEDTVSFREHQDKVRENLGICVTIFGIIMVAVIVTTLKIIFFDKETYPSVFFTPEEIMAMKNKTVGFTLFTQLRINCRQSEVGGQNRTIAWSTFRLLFDAHLITNQDTNFIIAVKHCENKIFGFCGV